MIQRPLKVECFYTSPLGNKCAKIFEVKYNRSCGGYTKRNNWSYWTEKKEDKDKYICSDCLISFYKDNKYTFWEKVTNDKKRNILRTYVNSNSLRPNRKIMPCDNSGCETACCFGCRCCEEKSKKIKKLERKINNNKNYNVNYKKRKEKNNDE